MIVWHFLFDLASVGLVPDLLMQSGVMELARYMIAGSFIAISGVCARLSKRPLRRGLIVLAAALAFVVLYNLTNIYIMERVREIATIKVLGFYPLETASYVLRENLMLSVLGGAAGLFLGKLFHRFMMAIIQVDYMHYDVRISALSYALAFAVTVVFALAANFSMRPKLDRVNMAESLKSVE